jgi:hypothetical protein
MCTTDAAAKGHKNDSRHRRLPHACAVLFVEGVAYRLLMAVDDRDVWLHNKVLVDVMECEHCAIELIGTRLLLRSAT